MPMLTCIPTRLGAPASAPALQHIEYAIIPLTLERPSPSIAEVIFETSPRLLPQLNDVRVTSDPTLPQRLVQLEEIQVRAHSPGACNGVRRTTTALSAGNTARGGALVGTHARARGTATETDQPFGQDWRALRPRRTTDGGRHVWQRCAVRARRISPTVDGVALCGALMRPATDAGPGSRPLGIRALNPDRPSQAFNEFLSILGTRIKLEGWSKFRGGLDVKSMSRDSGKPRRTEAHTVSVTHTNASHRALQPLACSGAHSA